MKTVVESVSPAKAAEWLKRNTRNRHLVPGKVGRFARDLIAGNWAKTHQSVGIAPTFIVDGQHRLTAIKESGIGVEINVTYYDSDDEGERAIMAIDITDKRTAGDMLEIAGTIRRGSGKSSVSVVRLLAKLGIVGNGPSNQPTISEVQLAYLAEQSHVDWCLRATESGGKRFSVVHRTAFAIAHMLEAEKTEAFASQVQNVESVSGSVAQAWIKAETEGRFSGPPQQTILSALRLLQCVLLDEAPPKSLKPTHAVIQWFRAQIEKKREREAKAAAQISAVMQ